MTPSEMRTAQFSYAGVPSKTRRDRRPPGPTRAVGRMNLANPQGYRGAGGPDHLRL